MDGQLPPMNPASSGDEELTGTPRDDPAPPLVPHAAAEGNRPVGPTPPRPTGDSTPLGGGLSFMASILLIAIAFSLGLSYLLEKRWGHHRAAVEEKGTTGSLNAGMFHVTSISLGSERAAMVNGQTVREGESISIFTPNGSKAAQVEKISNGTVRFVVGAEAIDVSVTPSAVEKHSP